jgi:hypothetical protein
MKAALEASVSNSNLFRQGAARETDDPEIVASTLANGASFSEACDRLARAFTENMPPAHRREG